MAISEWSSSVDPLKDLGVHLVPTLNDLAFLGNGIDDRIFKAGQQKDLPALPGLGITLSPVVGPMVAPSDESDAVYEFSFLYIFADSTVRNGDTAMLWTEMQLTHKNFPHRRSPVEPKKFQPMNKNPEIEIEYQNLTLAERTRQHVVELQAKIKEHQDRLRELEEELYLSQLCLGEATAPKHLQLENIFESNVAGECDSGEEDDFDSPGGDTLIEPCESILEAATEPRNVVTDSSSLNQPESEAKPIGLDVEMELDSQAIRSGRDGESFDSSAHRSVETSRKRKNFSKFVPSLKKSRLENGPFEQTTQSHVEHLNQRKIHDVSDIYALAETQKEDDSKDSSTTRPSSWPRTRRFRKSAGVSVRKLTDMFERMRTVPPIPSL